MRRRTAAAEEEKQDQSWRSLWLSSGALSLALLGDSLIYVVLSVNAGAFGVSLFWVGILLAANRVICTFTYGFVVHFGQRVGLRNLRIIVCIISVLLNVSYGVFQGLAYLAGGCCGECPMPPCCSSLWTMRRVIVPRRKRVSAPARR